MEEAVGSQIRPALCGGLADVRVPPLGGGWQWQAQRS